VNIQFRASFAKDLRNIKNKELLNRIRQTIEHVEKAQSQQDITNCKKLRGGSNYYRIRVGEYRIG
jgi:mRNA interferase RelE/StbE